MVSVCYFRSAVFFCLEGVWTTIVVIINKLTCLDDQDSSERHAPQQGYQGKAYERTLV